MTGVYILTLPLLSKFYQTGKRNKKVKGEWKKKGKEVKGEWKKKGKKRKESGSRKEKK